MEEIQKTKQRSKISRTWLSIDLGHEEKEGSRMISKFPVGIHMSLMRGVWEERVKSTTFYYMEFETPGTGLKVAVESTK